MNNVRIARMIVSAPMESSMPRNQNPMTHLYESQLEASRRLAAVFFQGAERLEYLVLEAAHRFCDEQLDLAQAMANGARAENRTTNDLVQRNSDEALNYQAELLRIVTDMQTEFRISIEEYIEEISIQPSPAEEPIPDVSGTRRAVPAQSPDLTADVLLVWEKAFKEAAALAAKNMGLASRALGAGETMVHGGITSSGRGAKHGRRSVSPSKVSGRRTH